MLLNAEKYQVTAFTVSELLRKKKQQGLGGGGKINPPAPTQIRFNTSLNKKNLIFYGAEKKIEQFNCLYCFKTKCLYFTKWFLYGQQVDL